MSWQYWNVGKVKDPHQLRKCLLKEFIHPEIVKHLKIKLNPAKMEFYYKDELILKFISDYFMPWNRRSKDTSPETALDLDAFIRTFKVYYQQKHHISAQNNDYYFRILTLLDKRTGKRTLKKILDNGDFFEVVVMNRDFRLEKLYRIRFELANIRI